MRPMTIEVVVTRIFAENEIVSHGSVHSN